MFDNNSIELSTISDEEVEKVNINKLNAYHHDNPPIDLIITIIAVDTRPSWKIKNRHRKRSKLNFPPNLHTKSKNLPWINPKPRGTLNENDIEWIEKKDSRSGILRMSKIERPKKSSYKGGKKTIILLYPRNM